MSRKIRSEPGRGDGSPLASDGAVRPGRIQLGVGRQFERPAPLDKSRIGLLQWFHVGQHELVEQALEDIAGLGVEHLRTGLSWADWLTEGGPKWFDWLLPRLARTCEILPCVLYTPPSLGMLPKVSSPPRDAKAYADFIDMLIDRYGRLINCFELWNEPNNVSEWDWTLDRDWRVFCQMIGGAAYWIKHRGRNTVLGGMSPTDPNWLNMMFDAGVMDYIDAVAIHGFPGVFEFTWEGWPALVERVQQVIESRRSRARIWITEAGYSTWKHEQRQQLRQFLDAATAPVDRMYWYSLYDLAPELPTIDGFHSDDREYHFGIKTHAREEKLLFRVWKSDGLAGLADFEQRTNPMPRIVGQEPAVLITGGAGFVATNLADRLLSTGRRVIIFDNLSRPGVEKNLRWLKETHGSQAEIEVADTRDAFALGRAVEQADQVYHLAAQVAVTTSLVEPRQDFDVNAGGTLNVLEAIRASGHRPGLVFTSTNKVYGALPDIALESRDGRYLPADAAVRAAGICETRSLDFHSPYGCSKGAAEQYVIDYARSFGLRTVVFRMSCIYGPHQFGTEDQGWVAHFLIRAIENGPITIYGDGKQVRDVLFVDDLVDAFLLAQANIDRLAGQALNIGGGPENTISLLDLIGMIERMTGQRLTVMYADWRVGDQRYYASNTRRFREATGWQARVSAAEGVRRLYDWLLESRSAGTAIRRPAASQFAIKEMI